MKKIKRILSSLLVAVMILSAVPVGQLAGLDLMVKASAAGNGIDTKINELKALFPEGSFFTTDNKPYPSNQGTKCYYPSVVNNNPKLKNLKLSVAGKEMTLEMWKRYPQEELFIGNETTCCTAIGTGSNAPATPLYLLNKSFNVVLLRDANNKIVGMSRVFMANIDNKPSMIMDNIELNKPYIKEMSEAEKKEIRDGFFDYINQYATQVTGDKDSQVYFYSGDINVPTTDLSTTNKTLDFIGDFSDGEVYINSCLGCLTPWINPKSLNEVNAIKWLTVPRK